MDVRCAYAQRLLRGCCRRFAPNRSRVKRWQFWHPCSKRPRSRSRWFGDLSEEHFVFFNTPRTPDGSVCAASAQSPDKAAIRVSFDALPQEADRFVLVAAVDPEANPDADLSGFTDACIRLLDPARNEPGRLDVSDGRSGEALVLGSFRCRPNGDLTGISSLEGRATRRVLYNSFRSTASKWSRTPEELVQAWRLTWRRARSTR